MLGQPLPLIRGRMLLPFAEVLRASGRDPDRLLKSCFCPVNRQFDDPDCIITTNRLWQVVERSSQELGDINFGWKTAVKHGVYGGGHLGYLWENQATLEDAMHLYANSLPEFANASKGKVAGDGATVWFFRGTVPRKGTPFSQIEQYAVGTMLHIVRCYLGKDWCPPRIRLVSRPPAKGELDIMQDCNEVIFNADRAGIEIPKRLLGEGKKELPNLLKRKGRPFKRFPRTLSAVLEQMLLFYLPDYKLTLETVSTILELHPRTLDRRLAVEGVSYRDVRNRVMSAWAKTQLADSALSIAGISKALDFSHQSAFSRAFRGWTGDSPQAYRNQRRSTDC